MDAGFEIQTLSLTRERQRVLAGVSLCVRPGQRVAVLGRSGCGKSTLLRVLAGLEAPTSGRLLLDGKVASSAHTIHMAPGRRCVSMVFQDLALWPNLSIEENVRLGIQSGLIRKREARDRTQRMLARCGIAKLAYRRPEQVSGGEQQRVALARALVREPRFLFLDEPFGGLDIVAKQELIQQVRELVNASDIALVLVTHDPFEALALCHDAAVLDSGRLEVAGNLQTLLREPSSMILRAMRDSLATIPV